MAERRKDEDDMRLESLFRPEPVQDDGFSVQVLARVRRSMWVRRLSLPVAFVIGIAVCARPILQLIRGIPNLVASIPLERLNLESLLFGALPEVPTLVMGTALLGAVMMIGRLLEDT